MATDRARFFFIGIVGFALFLAAKLVIVQAMQGPQLARDALAQRSDTIEVFARRGSILDRHGAVIARSLPSKSIYAVPHDITDPDTVARALGKIVGKLDPATVAALHDKSLWFIWIARKVDHSVATRVAALHLDGVAERAEKTGRRVYVDGPEFSSTIGFVGTDENGLDGLEYSLNSWLEGRSGKETMETDEMGRRIPFGHDTTLLPARPGYDIELTLDSYLQFVAERALEKQVKAYHASSGVAIVMDPQTGGILALANLPHFDPNHFWRYSNADRRDRAVEDAYEPGSTYKLITAAAAIQSGKVTLASRFPSRDSITVGGHTIHNADDGFTAGSHGSETLENIIAYSHNVGAAEVGLSIGARTFYNMERAAGFGEPTQIELPGENPGIVPKPSAFSGSSLATMSFGQGVAVTPLALARYYCAIANGGLLLRPHIVHAILKHNGAVVYRYPVQIERRIFSERTAAILRRFLRAVVRYGTGDPAAQIPGYTTAGKTGTAQIEENGVYQPGAYVASFIGMIPARDPRFVILIKVDRPIGSYYGSQVAAPAFDSIARAAMLHAGLLPRMVVKR
ncbi:MAG TPA: penicillin-binding protein 2 [Candidatus Dormibacteraeota bacterium]|nr:penicillin-binding protein 2 [Candidatus Dormibacteraeota bacterium]